MDPRLWEEFRSNFPAVEHASFFDNAGGTQTPRVVADAISAALTGGLSQRGQAYREARNADQIVLAAREAMGDLLGGPPGGVVFGRSATALILDFATTLTAGLGPGDEIAVSRLDHDANIRPWVLAAKQVGASIAWIDFDPATGNLTRDHVAAAVTPRTRIVALTAASNLYGTMPDIAAISELVREVGATFFVDAVAYAPHELVDVEELDADYLVCSPYKFFGPHLGVLAARPELLEGLHPRKLLPSPDTVPERFEHGTLPYELLAGVTATVDFLASFGGTRGSRRDRLARFYADSGEYEREMSEKIIAALGEVPGVRRIGDPTRATPTVLFTIEGQRPERIAEFLGQRGIAVSAGSFYAHEAVQHARLGDGGIRLSLAPYTTAADVDALISALRELTSGANR